MIFDLNAVPAGEPRHGYDVGIVGAGAAGIALAMDLADRGLRVLLLEAGGTEFSEESQDVYRGMSIGRSYHPLNEARLRFLGGTTNHWEGQCRPLDDWDFEKHDHIPNSGWPISKRDLDPYLERASRIVEIPATYGDRDIVDPRKSLSFIEFQFSAPVRLGEKYRQSLEADRRIDLFLNANVVDIVFDDSTERVTEVLVAKYADPHGRHSFAAKTFVLAMGGMENPRLLLNCLGQGPDGIGNASGLVGRYFMDHLHIAAGYYAAEKGTWLFGDRKFHLATTRQYMEQRKIGGATLKIGPVEGPPTELRKRVKQRAVCAEDAVREFVRTFYDLWCPMTVYVGGYVETQSEQVPNRDSRVFLSDETDRFGLRRITLDWRLSDIDRRTIVETATAMGRLVATQKYGNVKLTDWLLDEVTPVPTVGEGEGWGAVYHHMGTTRMAGSAADGVVDSDCRVFGTRNLYVAGSSVFPTGGYANPTLTILQLALRLGEHLAGSLKA